MVHTFNKEWYERNKLLTFDDLTDVANAYSEVRFYEKGLPQHARVLDVGVGLGYETAYFLQKGLSVDALDADARVLALLAKRCNSYSSHLKLLNYSVPFGTNPLTGKYDLIILSNILHYLNIDEIKQCITQLLMNLSEKGLIVVRSHEKKHPYNNPTHPKNANYKYFFDVEDFDSLFPMQEFRTLFKSAYYRVYNPQECLIFGYDAAAEPYKYGVSAVLQKTSYNGV